MFFFNCNSVYAQRTHAPPAARIFFSARLEKNLALTITGTVICHVVESLEDALGDEVDDGGLALGGGLGGL